LADHQMPSCMWPPAQEVSDIDSVFGEEQALLWRRCGAGHPLCAPVPWLKEVPPSALWPPHKIGYPPRLGHPER
jgi:hypothetical protein